MKLYFLLILGVLACCMTLGVQAHAHVYLSPDVLKRTKITTTSACNNTADLTAFHDHWDSFRGIVQKCGLKCVTRNPCTANCIANKTSLSQPCATCFGQSVACVRDNCYWSCLNPNSKKCERCSIKNCVPSLQNCTGCTRDKEEGHCQLPPY